MQINQNGRSMVEMLGVLAIIGVLSVGGLVIVGKARRQQEITKAVTEVAQLISSAKKVGCQYDSEYGDFANMLGQSDAYPGELEFTYKNGGKSSFTLSSDAVVEMPYIEGNGDGEAAIPHFVVAISNMDEDMCVNLATADWGRKESNGYIGASFAQKDDFGGMLSNYPRMDPGTAAEKCVQDTSKLYLGFRNCL